MPNLLHWAAVLLMRALLSRFKWFEHNLPACLPFCPFPPVDRSVGFSEADWGLHRAPRELNLYRNQRKPICSKAQGTAHTFLTVRLAVCVVLTAGGTQRTFLLITHGCIYPGKV